jgi:hypothetical protein
MQVRRRLVSDSYSTTERERSDRLSLREHITDIEIGRFSPVLKLSLS